MEKSVTHLQHNWSWCYKPTITYKQQSAEDWMADFQPVIPKTFSTAEEFWSIANNLPTFNDLNYGSIYSVFKENISPVWEHPKNENGYSIIIYINKNNKSDFISNIYENSLLLLIGNNLSCSNIINGCTFERKAGGNKIVFWMQTSSPSKNENMTQTKEILIALGLAQRDLCFCEPDTRIDWKDKQYIHLKLVVTLKCHRVCVSDAATTKPQPQPQSKTNNQALPHLHRKQASVVGCHTVDRQQKPRARQFL